MLCTTVAANRQLGGPQHTQLSVFLLEKAEIMSPSITSNHEAPTYVQLLFTADQTNASMPIF